MKSKPTIRFSEFNLMWEQRKLKEVTERVSDNDGRMNLPTLTISAARGWLDQRERFSANIAGEEQKKYTLLSQGELSYNKGNSKLAKYGVVFELKDYKEALVPRIYHSFRVNNLAISSFIEYMFSTKKPDRELVKLISSGARMDGLLNIGYEDFMGINIRIPNVLEQEKIASLFRSLDKNIKLQQQELTILKQTKQGFLQKMFPKEGLSTPEVRFPEFTGDWEQRKLGELGKTYNGLSGKTKEDFGIGNAEFVTYLNVFNNPISDLRRTENVEIDQKQNEVKYGDVFFTTSSETPNEVGMSSVWLDNRSNVYLNSFCFGFRLQQKADAHYMGFLLRTNPVRKQFILLAQGISRYNISKVKAMDIKVSLPEIDEQIKIGNFFKQLDKTIALHQQELELLQETKKAFLQKMFI